MQAEDAAGDSSSSALGGEGGKVFAPVPVLWGRWAGIGGLGGGGGETGSIGGLYRSSHSGRLVDGRRQESVEWLADTAENNKMGKEGWGWLWGCRGWGRGGGFKEPTFPAQGRLAARASSCFETLQ